MKLANPLFLVAVIYITYFIPKIIAYNVLAIFPHTGSSHFDFFAPLLKELAKQKNDVTVVSYFPVKTKITNYTDMPLTGLPILRNVIDLKLFENVEKPNAINSFFMLNNWGLESFETALKSNAIKKILSSEKKYDVILLEQFNNDGMYALAHIINPKAPIIALSSCNLLPWSYDRMGAPFISSYISEVLPGFSQDMSFFERLVNWYSYHITNILYKFITQKQTDALVQKYFPNHFVPSVEELIKNTSLMLINQHYSLSGVKPWPPNVVEVGGLQISEEKPIERELKEVLDSATDGVIYINWGSLLKTDSLPDYKREAILKAVGRFEKMKVIWKWENETMPDKPSNVIIRKWLPQRELLCHPNVKVFLNHGGLLGASEATHCKVPMVTTPILGDQYLNANAIAYRKIGTILFYHLITEENVFNAISKVLNTEFRRNIEKVSDAYRNRLEDPLKLAVWWVNKVVDSNGLPLAKSHSINLPWMVYYSCDIYFTVILVPVIVLSLIVLFRSELKFLFLYFAQTFFKVLSEILKHTSYYTSSFSVYFYVFVLIYFCYYYIFYIITFIMFAIICLGFILVLDLYYLKILNFFK